MIPPFCPNPVCPHHKADSASFPIFRFYTRIGFYLTAVVGLVERFKCKSCGRSFSERTFSIDYYTKKNLDNREIFRSIGEGESVSSISRHLQCSLNSIRNRLDRLGRASIALHASLTSGLSLS